MISLPESFLSVISLGSSFVFAVESLFKLQEKFISDRFNEEKNGSIFKDNSGSLKFSDEPKALK